MRHSSIVSLAVFVSLISILGPACGSGDWTDSLDETFSGDLNVSGQVVLTDLAGGTVALASAPAELLVKQTRHVQEDGDKSFSDVSVLLTTQGASFALGIPEDQDLRDDSVFVDAATTGQGVPVRITRTDTIVSTRTFTRNEDCSWICGASSVGSDGFIHDDTCYGNQDVRVTENEVRRDVRLQVGTPSSTAEVFEAVATFDGSRVFKDTSSRELEDCHSDHNSDFTW